MTRQFLWSCVACLASAQLAFAQAPLPSLETVAAAWDAQGEKYKSVKLTWTEKVHRTGYVSAQASAMMAELETFENRIREERGEAPVPMTCNRNEFRFENRYEFSRKGISVRLDKKGMTAFIQRVEPRLDNQTVSFNGKSLTWLREQVFGGMIHSTHFDAQFHFGFGQHFPLPVFGKVLMGQSWGAGDELEKMKYCVESHGPVQGLPAIQLTYRNERTCVETTYVLIPSLDYAIAEYEHRLRNLSLTSYRATFDPKRTVLPFVPKSAKTELIEDGNRLTWSKAQTFGVPVVTATFPPSHFEIDPPKSEKSTTEKPYWKILK